MSLDVTSNAIQLISRPLSEYVTLNTYDGGLRSLEGTGNIPAFTVDDRKIIIIKNNQFEMLKTNVVDPSASVALVDSGNGPVVLQAWMEEGEVKYFCGFVLFL